VLIVDFIIRIYHDARPYERQIAVPNFTEVAVSIPY